MTTSTSAGSRWIVERLPGALQQQRVAGLRAASPAVGDRSPPRWIGEDDQVAAWRSPCREKPLADQRRARRDHHLGKAGVAVEQRLRPVAGGLVLAEGEVISAAKAAGRVRVAAHQTDVACRDRSRPPSGAPAAVLDGDQLQPGEAGEVDRRAVGADQRRIRRGRAAGCTSVARPYCSTSVCAWRLKSGGRVCRSRFGSSCSPKQHDDERSRRAAAECRPARTRRSRSRRRRHRLRRFETSTLTGVPVSASSEPAWAAKTSGISSCDGDRLSRTAMHHHHRQERGDRAVDADQRGEQRRPAASSARAAGSRLSPAPGDQQLAGPGGDAGRLQAGADDEQRGDEDHRRIAEAGQAWPSVRTPVAQSASAPPCRPRSPAAGPRRTAR